MKTPAILAVVATGTILLLLALANTGGGQESAMERQLERLQQLMETRFKALSEQQNDVKKAAAAMAASMQQQQQSAHQGSAAATAGKAGAAPTSNKLPESLRALSRSQGNQDGYMYETHFHSMTEPGVFVEFGGRDGVADSNTHMFEKGLNWHGVLVEAVHRDYEQISKNRPNSIAVNAAVCSAPGTIKFLISANAGWHGKLDTYPQERLDSGDVEIEVPCITLADLLEQTGLTHVHYMTIDTEGSEYEILSVFDTSRFVIDFIQVEVLLNAPADKPSPTKRFIEMMYEKGYDLDKDMHFASDTSDLIFKRTNRADLLRFDAAKQAGVKVKSK